jgi:hypothetical protein
MRRTPPGQVGALVQRAAAKAGRATLRFPNDLQSRSRSAPAVGCEQAYVGEASTIVRNLSALRGANPHAVCSGERLASPYAVERNLAPLFVLVPGS